MFWNQSLLGGLGYESMSRSGVFGSTIDATLGLFFDVGGGAYTFTEADDDLGPIDIHPGKQRRFLVAADGHGVAPVGGVVQQPAEKQEADDGDQDGHRHTEQLAVAEDEERLLRHAHRFAVGKNVRQTTNDLHGRQRRDQGIDAQLGNHNAVDQPDNQAHHQRRADAEEHAVGVAHHHRRDDPGAGDHRAHRQVEMPRRQAVQHGARGNAGGGNRQAQATHVER